MADFSSFATFAGFSVLAGLADFAADLVDAVLDAGALGVTGFAAGFATAAAFALVAGLPLAKVGLAGFATGLAAFATDLAEAFEVVALPPAAFAALAAFAGPALTDTDFPAAGFFADEPTGLAIADFAAAAFATAAFATAAFATAAFATDALALVLAAADAFVAAVDLATFVTGVD